MIIFETPQDLLNYIPTCVLCGKDMPLLIEGGISIVSGQRFSSSDERMRITMQSKDGILYSKNKKYPINVDIVSGKLINGADIFSRLRIDYAKYLKSCTTCDFKIECVSPKKPEKDLFPVLHLKSERIHYTLRGGKEVEINKSYYNDAGTASIRINKKYLPPMPGLDFHKFKDLDHLNQRLGTLIVFG